MLKNLRTNCVVVVVCRHHIVVGFGGKEVDRPFNKLVSDVKRNTQFVRKTVGLNEEVLLPVGRGRHLRTFTCLASPIAPDNFHSSLFLMR